MTNSVLVQIHFYKLSDYGRQSLWNWLKGRIVLLFSEYVHCNYQIGSVVYDLSVHGYNVFERGYPVHPNLTVEVRVSESDVRSFISRFAADYLKSPFLPYWLTLTLGTLPLFRLKFFNCATYPYELVKVIALTPEVLARKVTTRRSVNGV